MVHKQFAQFVLTGALSAIVNMVSRYILNFWLSFPYAVAVAYLFGLATAYVLARQFVFGQSGRSVPDELLRFSLVNIVSFLQVWAISVLLGEEVFPAIGFERFHLEVAHFIALASPTFTSYVLHRRFSFAKTASSDRRGMPK